MENFFKKYKSCSSQIEIPGFISKEAMSLAMKIDKNITLETEKDFHVTIKYGIIEINPDMVRKMVEKVKPFYITFGKIGVFEKEDEDVVFVEVKDSVGSGGLVQLRRILDNLEEKDAPKYAKFVPHMTIAYVKKGEGNQFKGMPVTMTGGNLAVSEIQYCTKNGLKYVCPLKSGKSLAELYKINSEIVPGSWTP